MDKTPVNIAFYPSDPYVLYDRIVKGQDRAGLSIELMLAVSQICGYEPNFVKMDDVQLQQNTTFCVEKDAAGDCIYTQMDPQFYKGMSNNQLDIMVPMLTMTNDRLHHFDLPFPFFPSFESYLYHFPVDFMLAKNAPKQMNYFNQFQPSVWFAVVVTVLLSLICIRWTNSLIGTKCNGSKVQRSTRLTDQQFYIEFGPAKLGSFWFCNILVQCMLITGCMSMITNFYHVSFVVSGMHFNQSQFPILDRKSAVKQIELNKFYLLSSSKKRTSVQVLERMHDEIHNFSLPMRVIYDKEERHELLSVRCDVPPCPFETGSLVTFGQRSVHGMTDMVLMTDPDTFKLKTGLLRKHSPMTECVSVAAVTLWDLGFTQGIVNHYSPYTRYKTESTKLLIGQNLKEIVTKVNTLPFTQLQSLMFSYYFPINLLAFVIFVIECYYHKLCTSIHAFSANYFPV